MQGRIARAVMHAEINQYSLACYANTVCSTQWHLQLTSLAPQLELNTMGKLHQRSSLGKLRCCNLCGQDAEHAVPSPVSRRLMSVAISRKDLNILLNMSRTPGADPEPSSGIHTMSGTTSSSWISSIGAISCLAMFSGSICMHNRAHYSIYDADNSKAGGSQQHTMLNALCA